MWEDQRVGVFAGEGPPRHAVFVKCSEGDVRRMGYMYGGGGLQTWVGGEKVTRVERGAL